LWASELLPGGGTWRPCIERKDAGARIEAGVGATGELIPVAVDQRLPGVAPELGELIHRLPHDRIAGLVTPAQVAMHGARLLAGVLAPGDHQRGEQPRVQLLVATARAEIHERDASVRLGDAVLEPGGDAQIVDLDRQRERGELVGRELEAMMLAEGAQGRDHDRARAAETDAARDRGRPVDVHRLVCGFQVPVEAGDGGVDEQPLGAGAEPSRMTRARHI
jgi:hypothetical protein